MSARGIIVLVCCISLFIGCQQKEENTVIPKDKLAAVYSDMIFAKELYSGNPPKYIAARDSILATYGTDTSAIRTSFSFYADDPVALDEIYNLAMERAEQRIKVDTATSRKDSLMSDNDSSGD